MHFFNVHQPHRHAGTPFGESLADRYDAEVRLADELIGDLLATVERLPPERRVVVAVASDHGEALGEHGVEGHATTLYEAELASTLLFRVPGLAPRVVDTPVALIDLAPTLLNLAGVPVPRPMPARSLVPAMRGNAGRGERHIISELLPDGRFMFDLKAIRQGDEKLLWFVRRGTSQLFDLRRDPGEQHDVADERPERARELLGRLQAWSALTSDGSGRQDAIAAARLERTPSDLGRPLDVVVEDTLRVHGIDVPPGPYRPGDRIPFTFYLETLRRTSRNYMVEVLFEHANGRRLPSSFDATHFPLDGLYPTHEWPAGELIMDRLEVIVPPRTPAGEISLKLAFREGDQVRLPFRAAGARTFFHPVGRVRISP